MAKLAELYKKAKAAGHPTSEIRGKNAEEIEALLANGGGKKTVAKKKSAVQAVTKKKRGRPKGSKNVAKASTAPPTKKRGRPAKKVADGNGDGRHLLSKVNYSKDEGWNPREGSPPDRIIKALKKFKGDREKVFGLLKSDVWDFVGKVKRNGEKRGKSEALDFLKYRIASTDWRFAVQTGQHEIATERAEYGSAGTGTVTKKKRGRPAKKSAGKPTKASKATKSAADGEVKEMSTQKLRKIVKAVEGKRGRPSALVLAARKELAKRNK